MNLSKTQYWIVIGITFGLLIVNGYLVFRFLIDDIPKQCPIPIDKISFCECEYNALGDKSLKYCICYPGEKIDIEEEILNGTE